MWPSEMSLRDFPGGPVINNPPCNAEGVGSIPSGGTKIPPAEKQLSPGAATTDLEPQPDGPCIARKGLKCRN